MAITYNYTTKEIDVDSTATLRSVYSDAMDIFAQASQMDDLIPLRADTPTLFTLINGWTFSTTSIQYLTSASLQDSAGDNIWTNVQTLGTIVAGTTLYIEQDGSVVYTAPSTGHINILLKTKDSGTEIAGQVFKVFARLFQKEYSSFSTTGGAIVSNVPLSTKSDAQLDIASATLDAYTGLSITWGTITRDVGDGDNTYSVLVDCGGKTLKEAYNWVQYQLLKTTDIDSGAGTEIGKLTDSLTSYTGSMITATGVFFEDFDASDANNIKYTDDDGDLHTPPVSVALSVDAVSAMVGGRVAIYELSSAYDISTYTPASIVDTLLDTTLDASGNASTTLIYTSDVPVVVRVRKAGYKPFEVGTTITSSGLAVTSINEEDTIYL